METALVSKCKAAKDPPRRAVVFVVGGCTYEEAGACVKRHQSGCNEAARDIAELNKTAEGVRARDDTRSDDAFLGVGSIGG
eukprot:Skav228597  [mRNA]  locus=scaffold1161:185259:186851:+ [translate_table: standard]